MRLIYVISDSLMNSVFDSQVLSMLEFLRHQGRRPSLLVSFERRSVRDSVLRKKLEVTKRVGTDVLIIERPPFLGRGPLKSLGQRLAKILIDRVKGTEPLVLHCRGAVAAYIAIQTKAFLSKLSNTNIKVLADIRGVPEELLVHTSVWRWPLNQFRYRELKRIEKTVYLQADSLCCVSNAFKDYIIKRFGRSPEKITVVHCAVDTDLFRFDPKIRFTMRHKLGLKDKLVLVYSGSLAPWQLPNKLLDFFTLVKKIHPNSHLLMLTKDTSAARNLLKKRLKESVSVTLLSLNHREVPSYLMAGDVGLLLREDTIINRVAFPTKFAEYLSSGLFVVTTQGIKDIARYITAYPVAGDVLHHFPELDKAELQELLMRLHMEDLLTDIAREERSIIAAQLFGAKQQFGKYLEVYNDLTRD